MTDTSRYTRCPKCETAFKVSQQMLQMAHGKVRCGACLAVFQATDHLLKVKHNDDQQPSEDVDGEKSAPKSMLERAAAQQSNQLGDALEQVLEKDSETIDQSYAEEMKAAANIQSPKPLDEESLAELDQSIDQEVEAIATEVLATNDVSEQPVEEQNIETAAVEQSEKENEDSEADLFAALEAEPLGVEEAFSEAVDEEPLTAIAGEQEANDQLQLPAELSAETESEIETETVIDIAAAALEDPEPEQEPDPEPTLESEIGFDAELDAAEALLSDDDEFDTEDNEAASESTAELEIEQPRFSVDSDSSDIDPAESGMASAEASVGDNLDDWSQSEQTLQEELEQEQLIEELDPVALTENLNGQLDSSDNEPDPLDEFEEIVARKKQTPRILMGLGLLLVLAIVGSYQLWHNRQQLAWDESWGGAVKGMCKLLPCELKPRRDVAAIKLRQRQVSADEQDENKLDIKMLITNEANFEQPYPTIIIKFSNSLGEQVATQRIEPVDYLKSSELKKSMPASSEVHIHFTTQLPHPDALGFEFQFQ